MKKCYIAGKVTGLPDAVYQANFKKADLAVSRMGFEPVNPCLLPRDHDLSWQSYMREAIKALLHCDAIYVLPDWVDSKGATAEVNLAKALGLEIIYQPVPKVAEDRIVRERDTYSGPANWL